MKSYNEKILTNPMVELVHISLDHDVAEAEKWAKSDNLPWPVVLMDDLSDDLKAFSEDLAPPDYVLVDSNGEIVSRGTDAEAKKKIFEIISGKTSG